MAGFACDRDAFSAEERKRHFEILLPALRAGRKSARELVDGYEFEFPSDAGELVSEWVAGERRCCPFLSIDVAYASHVVTLRLTGPEGAKQFIRAELFQLFEAE